MDERTTEARAAFPLDPGAILKLMYHLDYVPRSINFTTTWGVQYDRSLDRAFSQDISEKQDPAK